MSHDLVEIQSVAIALAHETEPAGDVIGGHITMRGVLRATTWSQDGDINSIILDGKSGAQLLISPSNAPPQPDPFTRRTNTFHTFTLQHDTGKSFPAADIFCVPIRSCFSRGEPVAKGLVLGPTGVKDQCERLGHFEAIGEGYRMALAYELLEPARRLQHPWEILDLDGGMEMVRRGTMRSVFGEWRMEKSVFTVV